MIETTIQTVQIAFNPEVPTIIQLVLNPAPPVREVPRGLLTPGSKGIDVSQHQGIIDYDTVVNVAKIEWVAIRASQGTTPDTKFKENWEGFKRLNIPRMAYHYYQNEIDPTAQFAAFRDQLGADWGELPITIDIEDQVPPLNLAELPDIYKYLELAETHFGALSVIYTGNAVMAPFKNEQSLAQHRLWLSQPHPKGVYTVPAPWTQPDILQHSWKGSLPGIVGDVDLDTMGDGVNAIKPEWWWRGVKSEVKDQTGNFPYTFQVWPIKDKVYSFRSSPGGTVVSSRTVSWAMQVSMITADGWLRVAKVNNVDWWIHQEEVKPNE